MNSKNSNDKESQNLEYFISIETLKKKLINDAKKGLDSLNPKRTPEYVEEQKIIYSYIVICLIFNISLLKK